MPGATRNVLFIQGGGEDAYDWDVKLARNLAAKLGTGYSVSFPRMPHEADPNYQAWKRQILAELKPLGHGTVLVGHSLGASMLIKMLAEGEIVQSLRGVFLIAAPLFREPEGWQWKEAELPSDAARKLPKDVPLFFYQGSEDETVPYAHYTFYTKTFRHAVGRALDSRNHQLNDDLTEVAEDIRQLDA
jgi:predicted alpha/beta hydrolase family esterase